MSYFLSRFRRVKLADLVHFIKLCFAVLPSAIVKLLYPNIWIVSEAANEARDNGYWFFKYVRENHPEQNIIYAINNDSPDYKKVSVLGKTVSHGSIKHWIIYLAANQIISSQKAMGPNAAICGFLEVYGLLNNNRIFLQHGITKDDMPWLYYNSTKFKVFICGAVPEYYYISNKFGYPSNSIKYTGFCRFDGLHEIELESKQILIMPTWREWIADNDTRFEAIEGTNSFVETQYYNYWSAFITDKRIELFAKQYDVSFVFFPHREMQKYLQLFPKSNEYLTIASFQDYDVQTLLRQSAMLITDYSSVFFDMIYMKKPIIFFQFDYERFRSQQYGEGYFDYRNNSFGKSFDMIDDVFVEIESNINNRFKVDNNYLNAHENYFKLYDRNNCKRVYEVIVEEGL